MEEIGVSVAFVLRIMAAVLNNNDPDNEEDIFVYMGGDMSVPRDVVRCRVHPSVTVIPDEAFESRRLLEEVKLCDGLLEIGKGAFAACYNLRQRIKIPATVRVIGEEAFSGCPFIREVELYEGLQEIRDNAFEACASLEGINFPSTLKVIGNNAFYLSFLATMTTKNVSHLSLLPDGVERLGERAFHTTNLTHFRMPSKITSVPKNVVSSSKCMVSVELSEVVTRVQDYAFDECVSLRNVAIPLNAEMGRNAFFRCTDLKRLFSHELQITNALKHRFDNLPIHKMIYYQSYNNLTSDQLSDTTNLRSGQRRALRSKLDPTGKQQDCLGMTPLHILACSSVQDIELYRVLIEKYPESLVIEDKWGALPLLYAVWGHATNEIVQYLVESYQSLYPGHEFNWTEMLLTIGRVGTPLYVFQKLLDLQQSSFPEQTILWDEVIGAVIQPLPPILFMYILKRSIKQRIDAIGVKQWRDDIIGYESTDKYTFLPRIRSKLARYEAEYHKLKEATSVLELVLWKNKINETNVMNQTGRGRKCKKVKLNNSDIRNHCRVNCGAGVIIDNVLPYLLPA